MRLIKNKRVLVTILITLFIGILIACYLIFGKTYSVYFNSKMGTSIKTQEIKRNGKVERPKDPIMEGYQFIGWYLGEEEFDFDTEINKDITLTAKWEKIGE